MNLSDEERRHLAMSYFGEIFPEVQDLLNRLTSEDKIIKMTEMDIIVCIHAMYLASIEYTRYCTEQVKKDEVVH